MAGINDRASILTIELLDTDLKPTLTRIKAKKHYYKLL